LLAQPVHKRTAACAHAVVWVRQSLYLAASVGVHAAALLVLSWLVGSYSPLSPTLTGEVLKREEFKHDGGAKTLASPPYAGEIVLRILAK